jgi:SdrD B-like domain/Bacterial Ig domain/Prealbumin-like fold domain
VAGSAATREDRRRNRGPKRFIVGAVALIIGGLLTAGALGDVAPITLTGSSASSDTSAATDMTSVSSDAASTTTTSESSLTYTPTIASDMADYPPGATVTITGAGWPAQDAIVVQTDDAIGKTWSDTGNVTSDDNGNFTYSFQLPNTFISDYTTTATDAYGLSATTAFTDANENVEGWSNTATPPTWAGTLNGNASAYREGQSIPVRYSNTLTGGTSHTLILKYDFANGSKHFIDHLTTVDRTIPITGAQICPGSPGLNCGALSATAPIPVDSSVPAGAQISGQQLRGYNISSLSFVGATYALSGGVKSIAINFTVAGTGNKDVAIAYGIRLARENEWGIGSGASSFPGASGKAYTNLDNASNDKNLSVNPNGVAFTAAIRGHVYNDLNGNGTLEAGEPGLAGVTVTATGPVTTTAVTQSDGTYGFSGLEAGTYSVNYTEPTNFVNTGTPRPRSATITTSGAPSDTSTGNEFFAQQRNAVISGTVLDDANGNGVDNSEAGLANATVTLFRDSGNGTFDGDPTDPQVGSPVTTTSSGTFSFGSLAIGTYFIVETNPSGYSSTNAIAGAGANTTTTKETNDRIKVVIALAGATSSGNKFLDNKPPNQAPTANPQSVSTNEDTAKTITLTGSDPDSNPLTFKITSLPTNGVLHDGTSVLGTSITTTPYTLTGTDVTFAPNANYNGNDSFQFKTNDGTVDSAAAATVSITVNPVNDAPAGADKTVTTNEDNAYTFVTADFGFSDPNDSPANALDAVKITTTETNGDLQLNGVSVTAGQFVLAADISAGKLKFVPDPNENGSPYASFTFQVRDDGGTANGGVNLDQSPNTLTVNVTPVNDKPVVTLSASSVSGQYSDAIPSVTVTATDIDNPGTELSFPTPTGLPGNLALTDNADPSGAGTVADPGTRTATISGRLNVACAGTQPSGQPSCTMTSPYSASITAKDINATSDAKTLAVIVTRENAQVSDFTPYATLVDGTDSDVDSLPIGMVVDESQDGNLSGGLTPGIGLANAKPISVSLVPVGTGSTYSCTATNTTYISGDPDSANASCAISNVTVNVYDATATIGGQYFTGGGEGVITVMDPSLGFTTGGGWFNYGDAKVNFGFNAKILKSGQVQGSLLTIFKRANGNYIVKSNAMGALAVTKVANQTYYSATLDGKATYGVPITDPALAPFCPGVWKCGGYSFRAYVEDIKEPGAGSDRYWIEVKDPSGVVVAKASLPSGAGVNAKTIVGGNIQVPQPQSGK